MGHHVLNVILHVAATAMVFNLNFKYINSFIHSLHWNVQNVMIPCHSQELLPFL